MKRLIQKAGMVYGPSLKQFKMIERIKSDVLRFFNQKQYHQVGDHEYQKKAIQLIRKLGIEFDIDSDLRNYTHYTGVIIDFDTNGNILDSTIRIDHDSNLRAVLNGEIVTLFIAFSDINKYLRIFLNRRYLDQQGEVELDDILINDVNHLIKSKIDSLINKLIDELGFHSVENEVLDRKVDWLNEVEEFKSIDFKPNVGDLVFGGFEIYSELGI